MWKKGFVSHGKIVEAARRGISSWRHCWPLEKEEKGQREIKVETRECEKERERREKPLTPPMIFKPASTLRKSNDQNRRLSINDVSFVDVSFLDGNPLSHQHSGYLSLLLSGFGSRGVETGIIEGVEKDEKHILLPIQEDVYKSCESISTLASDLFEDVRASIQKSSKKSTPSTSNIKVSSSPSVPFPILPPNYLVANTQNLVARYLVAILLGTKSTTKGKQLKKAIGNIVYIEGNCFEAVHKRSFSVGIKLLSGNKSSSSTSSVSGSTSFSFSNKSYGCQAQQLLKRCNNANLEIENSIQGAIAHYKKCQQMFSSKKTAIQVGIYSMSASRTSVCEDHERVELWRG
ncbi:hypothetical protein JHK82_018230 [Glycine max]|nr:hypothetical protein JHK82_018230 [Glycine max]